ncbi:hypothetical protein NZK35_18875 [Stieleria sp. ICT_E10.1]|uniref:leucine-rich repeat domain-containing protein n=1 Tax=Stieleria sedimenti TaxID=2976331 RepID=UPI00217F7761|nr:hypothetical protein [Stieleria sedimenti]MCS7468722.1 hypothetical protein [Stieleria sedimenti]
MIDHPHSLNQCGKYSASSSMGHAKTRDFSLRVVAFGVIVILATTAGCSVESPSKQKQKSPPKSSASAGERTAPMGQDVYGFDPDDQDALKIEVIGTYRIGDGEYVLDQIKSILPGRLPWSSWGSGGNLTEYEVPSTIDADAIAKKIHFGKIIKMGPDLIRVEYSYDHEVPVRFKQGVSDHHQAPEDELGPALIRHDGDWWAALDELSDLYIRKRNQRGEIVRLGFYSASDETLRHLAGLQSLQQLELSGRHVTDRGARYLRDLTNLEELDLFATSIGNPGQACLSGLTNLKSLKLSGNGTEEGLEHLTKLTQLESLSIGYGNGYPVTTDGLQSLKRLRNLKSLRLDGCEISDAGLEFIAKFSELEALKLEGGTMTDAGLAKLSGLQKLRELDLAETAITDAGMVHLSQLPELRWLDISKTAVTDEGLEQLSDAPNLRNIRAEESGVSQRAIQRFKGRQ